MKNFKRSLLAAAATGALLIALQASAAQTHEWRSGGFFSTTTVRTLFQPLALEVSGASSPPTLHELSTSGIGSIIFFREYLKASQSTAARPLSGLVLESKQQSGQAHIQAWAMFNGLRDQEWWKNRDQVALGTFTLRAGETAQLPQLKEYGFEPLTFKPIPVERSVVPLEQFPVKNQTRSLQLVKVEKVLDDYRLTFQNQSDKSVVAYRIGDYDSGGSLATVTAGSSIAPKAEFLGEHYQLARSFRMTAQGYEALPPPTPGIQISAAIFDDGSFEGDERFAYETFLRRDGRRHELAQALPEIKRLLTMPTQQIPQALADLKARISQLPQEEKQRRLSKPLTAKEERDWQLFEEGMYDGRNLIQGQLDQIQARLNEPQCAAAAQDCLLRSSSHFLIQECKKRMRHPV